MEGDDGWRRTPRARVQNTLGSAASLAHRMLGLPREADAVRDTWLLLSRSAAGEPRVSGHPPGTARRTAGEPRPGTLPHLPRTCRAVVREAAVTWPLVCLPGLGRAPPAAIQATSAGTARSAAGNRRRTVHAPFTRGPFRTKIVYSPTSVPVLESIGRCNSAAACTSRAAGVTGSKQDPGKRPSIGPAKGPRKYCRDRTYLATHRATWPPPGHSSAGWPLGGVRASGPPPKLTPAQVGHRVRRGHGSARLRGRWSMPCSRRLSRSFRQPGSLPASLLRRRTTAGTSG
jgi:hypothetical protein